MQTTIYSVARFLRPFYRQHLAPALGGKVRVIQHDAPDCTVTDYVNGVPQGTRDIDGDAVADELIGDVLVVWNGLIPCYARVAAAAEAKGMRVAYVEGGPLAGTYQVDPCGTNGASSITALTAADIRQYRHADPNVYHQEFTARVVNREDSRQPLPADVAYLPAAYYFVPMQCHGDTQLTHFSPYATMEAFLGEVVKAGHSRGFEIVAKEHPWEMNRGHYDALRAKHPTVKWCRTRDVDSLVTGAAVVVTINSTVGVQAMLRKRPVVTVGTAFYAKPGLVHRPQEYGGLRGAMDRARADDTDSDLRTRFLTFLRDKWCIRHSEPLAFAQRVKDIAAGRAPWLEALRH